MKNIGKKTDLAKSSPAEPKEAGVSLVHQEFYYGPIPSASGLARYEKVQPGAADRLIKMAENQAKHRQDIESKALSADIKSQHRGQIFGFSIFVLTIIIGFILILQDKEVIGIVSILGSLGAIIGLFVYTHKSSKDENNK